MNTVKTAYMAFCPVFTTDRARASSIDQKYSVNF